MSDNRPVRILCVAEAFGFGPASKMLALIKRLRLHDFHLTFLGNGCAYELCRKGNFERVVNADPTNTDPGSPLQLELERNDLLITAMEFTPIIAAKSAGLKTVVLDSLFWMWPRLPCDLSLVDLYLCQNFIGVPQRRTQLCSDSAIIIIPPLTIADAAHSHYRDRVMMNLGGLDNPFAQREQLLAYSTAMVEAVYASSRRSNLHIDLYGREWVLNAMKASFGEGITVHGSVSPEQFGDSLKRAKYLITSPGLEVLYEGFTQDVPVFLLPPQNNSQSYQAHYLQREIPLLPGPQYPSLINAAPLSADAAPREAIQTVLDCARSLYHNKTAMEKLSSAVENFIHVPYDSHAPLRSQQTGFITRMRLGADVCFFTALRRKIEELLVYSNARYGDPQPSTALYE